VARKIAPRLAYDDSTGALILSFGKTSYQPFMSSDDYGNLFTKGSVIRATAEAIVEAFNALPEDRRLLVREQAGI